MHTQLLFKILLIYLTYILFYELTVNHNFYQSQNSQFGYSSSSSRQGKSCSNMSLIVERSSEEGGAIYIGNLEAASNVEYLKRHGIQAVLTVAGGTGLRYSSYDIPMHETIDADDTYEQDLSQYFNRMIDFIQKARKSTNILVHCYAGISRSVTAVVVYLMQLREWNYERTISFIRTQRNIANPNPSFVRQIKQFELSLHLGHRDLSNYNYDQRGGHGRFGYSTQPLFESSIKVKSTLDDLYATPAKRTSSAISRGYNYSSNPRSSGWINQNRNSSYNPYIQPQSISKALFSNTGYNPYSYAKQHTPNPIFGNTIGIYGSRLNSSHYYPPRIY